MILWLKNQCKPYEEVPGHTDKVVEILTNQLDHAFGSGRYLLLGPNYLKIVNAFKQIKRRNVVKPKVGIVGEIYMKYAPLGNNDLENYLISQGAQPVVTGVLDFMLYSLNNNFVDTKLYSRMTLKSCLLKPVFKLLMIGQVAMRNVIRLDGTFMPPATFAQVQRAARAASARA